MGSSPGSRVKMICRASTSSAPLSPAARAAHLGAVTESPAEEAMAEVAFCGRAAAWIAHTRDSAAAPRGVGG
eukprot:7684353-Alexandrium_andersonii.AAC.1